MDYGKYKYELSKKEHQSRRHQKSTQVKEIKLRPRTDKHDLQIKIRQIRSFLAEGNKTKVSVNYRGREMANQEMGRTMMQTVIEQLSDAGNIEYAPAWKAAVSSWSSRPRVRFTTDTNYTIERLNYGWSQNEDAFRSEQTFQENRHGAGPVQTIRTTPFADIQEPKP